MSALDVFNSVRQSSLAPLLDEVKAQFMTHQLDDKIHPGHGYCSSGGRRGSVFGMSFEMLTLAQAYKRLCKTCARSAMDSELPAELKELARSARARARAEHLGRGGASASTLAERLREVAGILAQARLEEEAAFELVRLEAEEAARAAEASMERIRSDLAAEGESVLAEVRKALGFEGAELDDTEVLVGLVPAPRPGKSLLRVLAEVSSVRLDDEVAVLRVPAYARDWVSGERGRGTVMTSPAGTTPAVDETACTLWDPSGAGPMRSLLTCVRAAEELV
jgi:hypothetical protein